MIQKKRHKSQPWDVRSLVPDPLLFDVVTPIQWESIPLRVPLSGSLSSTIFLQETTSLTVGQPPMLLPFGYPQRTPWKGGMHALDTAHTSLLEQCSSWCWQEGPQKGTSSPFLPSECFCLTWRVHRSQIMIWRGRKLQWAFRVFL